MAADTGGLRQFLRAGPITWLLAAACGWALLFWLGTLLGMGAKPGEAAPLPAEALPAPGQRAPDRIGPLSQYAEAASRPLFTEDRKPRAFMAVGPAEGDTEAARSSMDFVLSGVLISPAVQLAILQPSGGGDSQRVRVGNAPEGAAGWRLVEVQPRRAVFEGPGGQMTLDLRTFGVAGAPPNATKQAATSAANAAAEAAEIAEARNAGPPMPPPTPDEAQRIAEIRKRIEARRAQLQSRGTPAASSGSAATKNTTSSNAPTSTRSGLQQVKE